MSSLRKAYFGCGCFWTKEYLFSQLPGVVATRTGYMGGDTPQPTYHQVCTKTTGHAEVVEVSYDPVETSLLELLKRFFSFHDATRDRSEKGGQYRSVVFWRKPEERVELTSEINALKSAGLAVTTSIEKVTTFWEAEERHQGYVKRTGRHCDMSSYSNVDLLTLAEIVRDRAI